MYLNAFLFPKREKRKGAKACLGEAPTRTRQEREEKAPEEKSLFRLVGKRREGKGRENSQPGGRG